MATSHSQKNWIPAVLVSAVALVGVAVLLLPTYQRHQVVPYASQESENAKVAKSNKAAMTLTDADKLDLKILASPEVEKLKTIYEKYLDTPFNPSAEKIRMRVGQAMQYVTDCYMEIGSKEVPETLSKERLNDVCTMINQLDRIGNFYGLANGSCMRRMVMFNLMAKIEVKSNLVDKKYVLQTLDKIKPYPNFADYLRSTHYDAIKFAKSTDKLSSLPASDRAELLLPKVVESNISKLHELFGASIMEAEKNQHKIPPAKFVKDLIARFNAKGLSPFPDYYWQRSPQELLDLYEEMDKLDAKVRILAEEL